MKKLISVFAIVIMLIGFSGNPSESQTEKLLSCDIYNPLDPRTKIFEISSASLNQPMSKEDNIFTMIIQKKRILDDMEVTPITLKQGDNEIIQYWQRTEDGLFSVAEQRKNQPEPVKLANKILKFKDPIKKGDTYESQLDDSKRETARIEEIDATTTVPYGQFTNCVKKSTSIANPTQNTIVEITSWHAPNIGIVKQIGKTTKNNELIKTVEYQLRTVDVKGGFLSWPWVLLLVSCIVFCILGEFKFFQKLLTRNVRCRSCSKDKGGELTQKDPVGVFTDHTEYLCRYCCKFCGHTWTERTSESTRQD
jgi:hypothetical protein